MKITPNLLPKPKRIMKRGLYEVMWGVKPRNYSRKIKKGKY